MLTNTLRRVTSSAQGTFGLLGVEGSRPFQTAELPWRDNVASKSCIPLGEYDCVWHQSPKFGWCYAVTHVPDRTNILFHAGNFAGDADAGWLSDVEGCILLGMNTADYAHRGERQRGLLASAEAIRRFNLHMARRPFRLVIV